MLLMSLSLASNSAQAEPTDRSLTILVGLPESAQGSVGFISRLPEFLGPAISARIRLSYNPAAGGVLAANRLSLAHPDGTLLGALPLSAVVTRTIEERTPYVLGDFEPVLLAWSVPYALVAPPSAPFQNLAQMVELNKKNPENRALTFYHDGLNPISPGTLQALAVTKKAGINLNLTQRANLTPALLIGSDPNVLMAWPLDQLAPDSKQYKIVAVLADTYRGPCAPNGLDLSSQKLGPSPVHDYLGFYFPNRTIQAETMNMAKALTTLAENPQIKTAAENYCLLQGQMDPAQTVNTLNREYIAQVELLASIYAGENLGQKAP
jgi:tripartite-type tricarboxylate transporter receptor subunit TctC